MSETRNDVAQSTYDALHKLEECLWRAETRYDLELMDKVFASDFWEIGRSGKAHSRADFFVKEGTERTFDAVLPLTNFQVRHLSNEVVQVTYLTEVSYGGHIVRGNRSSIWTRRGDTWELRFHQGTPAA